MNIGSCRFNLGLNLMNTLRKPVLPSLLMVGPQEFDGMVNKPQGFHFLKRTIRLPLVNSSRFYCTKASIQARRIFIHPEIRFRVPLQYDCASMLAVPGQIGPRTQQTKQGSPLRRQPYQRMEPPQPWRKGAYPIRLRGVWVAEALRSAGSKRSAWLRLQAAAEAGAARRIRRRSEKAIIVAPAKSGI